MYTPAAFEENDLALLHSLMRQYSFATLVTVAAGVPIASHLPFLLDIVGDGMGTLRAHLARANPQWQNFCDGAEALVIFQGPHAYISPAGYESLPNVPTWNYAAVHAYGIPSLLNDEDTSALLRDSVAFYDPNPDVLDMPDEYVRRIQPGVVGFEIPIARLEGKRKMSQNKSDADRAGVIAALRASGSPENLAVAAEMERLLG